MIFSRTFLNVAAVLATATYADTVKRCTKFIYDGKFPQTYKNLTDPRFVRQSKRMNRQYRNLKKVLLPEHFEKEGNQIHWKKMFKWDYDEATRNIKHDKIMSKEEEGYTHKMYFKGNIHRISKKIDQMSKQRGVKIHEMEFEKIVRNIAMTWLPLDPTKNYATIKASEITEAFKECYFKEKCFQGLKMTPDYFHWNVYRWATEGLRYKLENTPWQIPYYCDQGIPEQPAKYLPESDRVWDVKQMDCKGYQYYKELNKLIGKEVEVNYQGKGVWYPATFQGSDLEERPGMVAVTYDDTPSQILGTLEELVRFVDSEISMPILSEDCSESSSEEKFDEEEGKNDARIKHFENDNAKTLEKLKQMETENASLQEKNKHFENDNAKTLEKLKQMETENASLQEKIKDLETKNESLRNELSRHEQPESSISTIKEIAISDNETELPEIPIKRDISSSTCIGYQHKDMSGMTMDSNLWDATGKFKALEEESENDSVGGSLSEEWYKNPMEQLGHSCCNKE